MSDTVKDPSITTYTAAAAEPFNHGRMAVDARVLVAMSNARSLIWRVRCHFPLLVPVSHYRILELESCTSHFKASSYRQESIVPRRVYQVSQLSWSRPFSIPSSADQCFFWLPLQILPVFNDALHAIAMWRSNVLVSEHYPLALVETWRQSTITFGIA